MIANILDENRKMATKSSNERKKCPKVTFIYSFLGSLLNLSVLVKSRHAEYLLLWMQSLCKILPHATVIPKTFKGGVLKVRRKCLISITKSLSQKLATSQSFGLCE